MWENEVAEGTDARETPEGAGGSTKCRGGGQRRSSEVMEILEGGLVSGPHSYSHDFFPKLDSSSSSHRLPADFEQKPW